jgi:hypothetical protein
MAKYRSISSQFMQAEAMDPYVAKTATSAETGFHF